MTNGSVTAVAEAGALARQQHNDQRNVRHDDKGRGQTIDVTTWRRAEYPRSTDAPIVAFVLGAASIVRPGDAVFRGTPTRPMEDHRRAWWRSVAMV